MRRIFFGIITNLGWLTMGLRLRDAIEQSENAKQYGFEPFTLPKALATGHLDSELQRERKSSASCLGSVSVILPGE
jgi:hypothetical protein